MTNSLHCSSVLSVDDGHAVGRNNRHKSKSMTGKKCSALEDCAIPGSRDHSGNNEQDQVNAAGGADRSLLTTNEQLEIDRR